MKLPEKMSTFEVALWRSVTAVPVLMLMYRNISWQIKDKTTISLRVILGFGALCSFFAAAKGLSIADLSLISKIQPILVAILAPILIGSAEKASRKLWGLMALAMIGCAILLAPSLEVGSKYGLFAVLAAIFSAHAHVFIRRLRMEHPGIIVLWFQGGSGILAMIACFITLGEIPLPQSGLWLPLVGVGLMATLGQLLMTLAYKRTKAATVAIASYAGRFSGSCRCSRLQCFPTWNVYIGGGIVVFSGVLLLRQTQTDGEEND